MRLCSNHVFKWEPATCFGDNLGGNLRWTSTPSRGSRNTVLVASYYRNKMYTRAIRAHFPWSNVCIRTIFNNFSTSAPALDMRWYNFVISNKASAERLFYLTLQGLTAIWVKVLIAISRVYQLVRSWELRTWALKFNSIDILTASPHYFCK